MTRLAKAKLLPLSLTLLLLAIVFLGWSNYRLFENQFVTQLTLDESELLSRGGSLFSRELGHIKSATLFLRNSIDAQALNHASYPQDESVWKASVVDAFAQFALTSPLISQVRWLSPTGQELIRINVKNGNVEFVPDDQLQDKSSRYYFLQAKYATGNNVYISPVDLNVENGKVVLPIEPTVRGVVSLEHYRKGVLVVNYNLTNLLGQIKALSNQRVFLDVVNPKGDWLVSQDTHQEWFNALKQDKKSNHFRDIYPAVWRAIEDDRKGLVALTEQGQIWSAVSIKVEDDVAQMNDGTSPSLFFIARSQEGVLPAQQHHLLVVISSIGCLAYVVIGLFIWWQLNAAYKRKALMLALEKERAQLTSANEKLTQVNHQLVELQNELVETSKLSALGMMVAGLAHEMNTPLGGVKMSLSSLSAQIRKMVSLSETDQNMLKSSLQIADKNLARAIDLVSSFKRITSHRTGHEVQSFSLNEVVHDLLFTYEPLLKKEPNLSLHHECEANIRMRGYPGILSQVIQNFIDNAIQHGLKNTMAGTIKLTASANNGLLKLTVEDDGCGISPDVKDHLFEPFVTTGRGEKHIGLGLHLVHQWVYGLMKGRIKITPLEKGVLFTVFIPLLLESETTE